MNFLKNPRTKSMRILRDVVIVLVSAFCGSSVQIFVMIPNGMTSGGIPGVARLVTHFFPSLSYSLVYYTLSMFILIVVYLTLGKAEVGRIIALAFTYPILMFFFERMDYSLLESQDPFLASLLIGVFYGLATGIGYIGGYSSGGTDSLARVIKYKLMNHVHIGNIQMAMDVAIIVISAFVFNMNVAIYAIVTAFVAAKVISAITVGYGGRFIQFDIIPSSKEKEELITQYALNDLNRGVSSHISRGEYTKDERRTLTVICTPAESMRLKKYVAEADPTAFATIMPITTVWGTHFTDIKEADNT